MLKEPIVQFVNQECALRCLKYWKEKLFLNDWIIKLSINQSPNDLQNDNVSGEVDMCVENMSAHIKILDPVYYGDRIAKYCAEATLVHELLHLKYSYLENTNSFEGMYYEVTEHQKIEQMAKTLIMTKYDLDFSWFDNTKQYENRSDD